MRQYCAYVQVLVWKLIDTLQHGSRGAPRRLEHTSAGLVEVARRSLLRDAWLQTHMFLRRPASPVLDRLWVGSALNAADRTFLACHNIRYIVNVTQEVPNLYEDTLCYCQVALRDVEGCTLPWQWISRFIHNAMATGDGVLIHCFLGRSRSVAVACHYLMCHLGYSFASAYAHLARQRPEASLNVDLAGELAAQSAVARLRLPAATAQ
jgi:hypothetical protein